jgi:hypothetical protein
MKTKLKWGKEGCDILQKMSSDARCKAFSPEEEQRKSHPIYSCK